MAASTLFFFNSFSYHDMTHNINVGGTPGSIGAHESIKKNDASCWGLVVKDLKKANANRRTTILKPKMMLNRNNDYPDMVLDVGSGRMLEDGFVFRQNCRIRSYEVGFDRTITAETLLNLLQESSINHLKAIGVWGDGLGLTRQMCKKKLIWVMAKLQVSVDRYPIWDDIIQIDTWKGAYGKLGMLSNWTFCDAITGEILLRASCVWLMMNEETRKLSKFPDEVRRELDEHFTVATTPIMTKKWSTRDESVVDYARNGLMPRWSDLDINQHVNNVKYIGWILESVPYSIVENYELASLTIEYCRECIKEHKLQSHTYVMRTDDGKLFDHDHVDCEHVLQLESEDSEIMKGWTTWRSKQYGNRLGLD